MSKKPKIKTIYLHIGTEKTGTTSLQAFGGINRERLAEEGLWYPRAPGNRSHLKLALFASDNANLDIRRHAGLFEEDDFDAFRETFAKELAAEISESGCENVFLCNEHLSSRVRHKYEVERLADVLKPLAESVKITVYLRRQDDLFRSHYSQAIKSGRVREAEAPASDQNHYYNYDLMLSPWAETFGDDHVLARIYDRKLLRDGDVVTDLFHEMGIDIDETYKSSANRNVRLNDLTLQFLLLVNRYLPLDVEDGRNPDRGDMAKALESIQGGSAINLPSAVLQRIMDMFEGSNMAVARRYLGREDGKLFPDAPLLEGGEPEVLTVERAVEIATHLWRWKQQQVIELKRRIARIKKRQGDRVSSETI